MKSNVNNSKISKKQIDSQILSENDRESKRTSLQVLKQTSIALPFQASAKQMHPAKQNIPSKFQKARHGSAVITHHNDRLLASND